jgi:hypothetical protein
MRLHLPKGDLFRAPHVGDVRREAGAVAGRALQIARRRPVLAACLMLTLGVSGVGAAIAMVQPEKARMQTAAIAPVWIDVARPLPMYGFDAPDFQKLKLDYAVKRMSDDSVRVDSLNFGAFDDMRPFLRLAVRRGRAEGPDTLYLAATRRAGESGLSLMRLGKTMILPTRFGPGEFAEAEFSRNGAGARAGCQAFHLTGDNQALGVSGIACGPDGASFDKRRLACLVDRIDLLGAGEDGALKTFFAEAELRRDPNCAARERAAFVKPDVKAEATPAPKSKPKKPRHKATAEGKPAADPKKSARAQQSST